MASVDRMTQNFFLMTAPASPSCTPQMCPRRAAGHRAAAAHNPAGLQQRAAPSQGFARSQKHWRSGFGSAFTEASGLQETPKCSLTLPTSSMGAHWPWLTSPSCAQQVLPGPSRPLGSQGGRCSCPASASQPFTHGFSSGVTQRMDPRKEKGRGLQGSSSAPLLASKSNIKSLSTLKSLSTRLARARSLIPWLTRACFCHSALGFQGFFLSK